MVFLYSEKTPEFCSHGHNRSKYKVFRVLTKYRHVNVQMYPELISKLYKLATVGDI